MLDKKNKILYIVNARIPTEKAHGRQICKMCEEFSKLGVEAELWTPKRKNPIQDNAFFYYNLEKNFKIQYIKSFDFLRFAGYLGRWSSYLQSLAFFLRILFVKIPQNVLIYTRNPELVWLLKLKGRKVVYECHDWFQNKVKLNLFLLKNCDYIITTNNYIKQGFLDNNFFKERLITAPNGVDLSIFNISADKQKAIDSLNINSGVKEKMQGKKVLLYTGSFKTMEVGKGIEEILEALRILKNKNLFFLAVGGSDKHIKHYNDLAKQMKVKDQALFLGRFSQNKLALFQKAADVLLMPFPKKAHYEYHMTPLKMFEYMAGNRPIIASSLPSIKQILNDKNCFFVRPGDFKDLAAKINFIVAKPELAKSVAEKALADVEKYTWENRVLKILRFIGFN